MIKELKKELSALSGVDFFNPKFRNVFKKYFPDEVDATADTAEEERVNEILEDEVVETKAEAVEDKVEEAVEEEVKAEETIAEETANEVVEDKAEEVIAENTEEVVEEVTNETPAEEVEEAVEEEVAETQEVAEEVKDDTELIATKVELELVKAGVREDRLEAAKKLLMTEINTLADISKVEELIKQYPEWLQKPREVAKPFGMTLDDNGDGLTEEEKKLKAMGINPR
jgi:hypothetical protein